MENVKQAIFDDLKAAGLFTKEKYHEDPAKEKLALEILAKHLDAPSETPETAHLTDPAAIEAYKAAHPNSEHRAEEKAGEVENLLVAGKTE